MQSFLDKNKKKWTIEINVGNARKVKAECNIDLINAIDFSAGSEKNVLQGPILFLVSKASFLQSRNRYIRLPDLYTL